MNDGTRGPESRPDEAARKAARKDAGMQMVLGQRSGPIDVGLLPEIYPWPAHGAWLRSMMVMTLDGASTGADGRSRSISSRNDRAVLDTTRRFSDVVLIGAGTFRAERYGPMRARAEDAATRAADGQAPAPVLAIASASLDLPWEEAAFARSDVRPIVVTAQSADPARLAVAGQHADLLTVPTLDGRAIVAALHANGLRRIVCEGGPTLLAELVRLDLVDEADLTMTPVMAGGVRIDIGAAFPDARAFALAQVVVDDEGFLYTRYVRSRPDGSTPGGVA